MGGPANISRSHFRLSQPQITNFWRSGKSNRTGYLPFKGAISNSKMLNFLKLDIWYRYHVWCRRQYKQPILRLDPCHRRICVYIRDDGSKFPFMALSFFVFDVMIDKRSRRNICYRCESLHFDIRAADAWYPPVRDNQNIDKLVGALIISAHKFLPWCSSFSRNPGLDSSVFVRFIPNHESFPPSDSIINMNRRRQGPQLKTRTHTQKQSNSKQKIIWLQRDNLI